MQSERECSSDRPSVHRFQRRSGEALGRRLDRCEDALGAGDVGSTLQQLGRYAQGYRGHRGRLPVPRGQAEGRGRLPGKHGTDKRFTTVIVMVEDRPGELGRLMTEIGEIGVNLEDVRLEHSPGRQVGLAEIAVLPEAADRLTDELAQRGWRIAG